MLLPTATVIGGPLWEFTPWSWMPRYGPLGKTGIGIAIVTYHVALIPWPCTYRLFHNILRPGPRL